MVVTASLSGDDSGRLLTIDHFVRVKSTVPVIAGLDKGTVNGAKDGILRLGY